MTHYQILLHYGIFLSYMVLYGVACFGWAWYRGLKHHFPGMRSRKRLRPGWCLC